MHFEIQMDRRRLTGVVIRPDESEDADTLHNYASTLKVKNAAVTFSEMARTGAFDDMSDEQYKTALEKIKTVSSFFDNKCDANVFHILAEAINFILQQPDTWSRLETDEAGDEAEEEE